MKQPATEPPAAVTPASRRHAKVAPGGTVLPHGPTPALAPVAPLRPRPDAPGVELGEAVEQFLLDPSREQLLGLDDEAASARLAVAPAPAREPRVVLAFDSAAAEAPEEELCAALDALHEVMLAGPASDADVAERCQGLRQLTGKLRTAVDFLDDVIARDIDPADCAAEVRDLEAALHAQTATLLGMVR